MTKKIENTEMIIEQVTYYKTSDGKQFGTRKEAEDHELSLRDPDARITRLENKILELEGQIAILKGRLDLRDNIFPRQPITRYPDLQPIPLPAEPGQVTYEGRLNGSVDWNKEGNLQHNTKTKASQPNPDLSAATPNPNCNPFDNSDYDSSQVYDLIHNKI